MGKLRSKPQVNLHGVDIPQSLVSDTGRSMAYAAGWLMRRMGGPKFLPIELRHIGATYRSDISRCSLYPPEITREESSFWAGYLASAANMRSRKRSRSNDNGIYDCGVRVRNLASDLQSVSANPDEFRKNMLR